MFRTRMVCSTSGAAARPFPPRQPQRGPVIPGLPPLAMSCVTQGTASLSERGAARSAMRARPSSIQPCAPPRACRTGPTKAVSRIGHGRLIRTRPIPTMRSRPDKLKGVGIMNKTYRNVWNAATHTWTAAAETAKSHSKGSARVARQALVAIALGSAAIGGAAAAEVCTAEDGTNGVANAGSECKVINADAIGTMGGIGINGGLDGGTATGGNSVAYGPSATASADNATAVGYNSRAGAGSATALGAGAAAAAAGSLALGVGAQTSAAAANATAVGPTAVVSAQGGLAVGYGANVGAAATNSAAMGPAAVVLANATNALALGSNARVANSNSTAIGADSSAAGGFSVALGRLATATNSSSISLGSNSTASADYGVALGAASGAGRGAVVTGARSVAIGTVSSASATDAVALGYGSVADRANTVSVGAGVANGDGRTFTRQIVNVAAGTEDYDAVNVGQLNAGLSTTNAAIAATDTALSTTNSALAATNAELSTAQTTLAATNTALSTATTQIHALDSGLSTANANIATHTSDIATINDKLSGLTSGTVGLVQQENAGADLTVGANTDGAAVNFAGTAGDRKLSGVAAGTLDSDAVNVGQLNAGLSTTNAAIAGIDGRVASNEASITDLDGRMASNETTITNIDNRVTANEGSITGLDGRVTVNEGAITKLADQIGSGSLGLVQQSAAGADLTVGANTDGAAVKFAGTAGDRKLSGVAAGTLDSDAVNVGQMNAGFAATNTAISGLDGRVTTNETAISKLDGRMTTSETAITKLDGRIATSETTITNIDNRVTANEGSIAGLDNRVTVNEGAITKLADQIGSGSLGLVQQANAGDDLTVGANTDGAAVNFAGTAGDRKLSGIAAGTLDSDAVNLGQMNAGFAATHTAISGLDGRVTDNETAISDLDGRMTSNETAITATDGRVTNIDNRVTVNEGALAKLTDQIGSGALGLVRQDETSGAIMVAGATGGTSVNFAGTGGARVLSGVANGVNDDDAVTVSQLRATGLIDYTGKEVGAVTYDSGLGFDTVTFAGTFGTKLQRVAAGEISATSMDVINGSQLFDLQEQFAKQYGDLSGQLGDLSSRFGDLSDRVGELETGGGSGGPGTGGPGTGDGSTVVGEGALASGENSAAIGDRALASGENASAVGQGAVASGNNGSAIGQGSLASGDNGSALGQGAVASGENGTALGQGSAASGANGTAVGQSAVASGENSTSLGQGASATGSGSVAIGQGSVATEANTVSFGNGTEEGNRRLVNIADGIDASDAATKGQLDRAMESVDARFNDTNRAINDVAKNAYAGIAAAMAMPNMTPSAPGKTVVAVGTANFKSGSAIAAGATYRSRNGKWLVNGAASLTSVGDAGVRAQVGYEF
ncbi:ESPR-type extended signal peptide-containing protein [Burkholderia multivorans]|uniref:ESPR-type extended signal peptide-containing protein n=1 Tax=Burkholderia multivorans TaxID=87883 RepID=UPI0021590320|nr:ESPR-type extended signal peptide-containing protein [Burkholderia multivorans]